MTALKDYIDCISSEKLLELAILCECSVGHLRNCSYGSRKVSATLARDLETHSGGKLSRKDLRPKDWSRLWPELAATKKGKK